MNPLAHSIRFTRLELQQEFRHLQQELGKTVVFVSHDILEAFIFASRIGLMCGKQLVVLGTTDKFMRSQHPESLAFLQCLRSL